MLLRAYLLASAQLGDAHRTVHRDIKPTTPGCNKARSCILVLARGLMQRPVPRLTWRRNYWRWIRNFAGGGRDGAGRAVLYGSFDRAASV